MTEYLNAVYWNDWLACRGIVLFVSAFPMMLLSILAFLFIIMVQG